MNRLFVFVLLTSILQSVLAEEREGTGLPECELIAGINRYIEIGNTISYTVDYLENNKYRCGDYQGKTHEIVSCNLTISHQFEVLLTVENGIVTDIETFQNGLECTYFNVKPLNPKKPDNN
jgi:hypothetical protein